eukprot:822842-Rhodomonas_salina.2
MIVVSPSPPSFLSPSPPFPPSSPSSPLPPLPPLPPWSSVPHPSGPFLPAPLFFLSLPALLSLSSPRLSPALVMLSTRLQPGLPSPHPAPLTARPRPRAGFTANTVHPTQVGSITGNTNTVGGGLVWPKASLGKFKGMEKMLAGERAVPMIDGKVFNGAKAYKDSKLCNMQTILVRHASRKNARTGSHALAFN